MSGNNTPIVRKPARLGMTKDPSGYVLRGQSTDGCYDDDGYDRAARQQQQQQQDDGYAYDQAEYNGGSEGIYDVAELQQQQEDYASGTQPSTQEDPFLEQEDEPAQPPPPPAPQPCARRRSRTVGEEKPPPSCARRRSQQHEEEQATRRSHSQPRTSQEVLATLPCASSKRRSQKHEQPQVEEEEPETRTPLLYCTRRQAQPKTSSPPVEVTVEGSANVVIVGGGPVGLMTALQLLEYGKRRNVRFSISIYERRWTRSDDKIRWCGSQEYNNRRWQVVTIQSNVWSLLSRDVQEALFPEDGYGVSYVEMWPYGPDSPQHIGPPRNIPVRIVEDSLLALIQEEPYASHVSLQIGTAEEKDFVTADFVILAHGGGKVSGIPDFGESVPFSEDPDLQLSETVLGIFVQHPEGGDAIGVSESEGMALSVAQHRLMLNPLGRQMGFLNMWLTWDEAQTAVGVSPDQDGAGAKVITCSQGAPCMLFNDGTCNRYSCKSHKGSAFLPAELKTSLWDSIQYGLDLYGIDRSYVRAFTTFRLGPFKRRINFFAPLSGSNDATNRRQPMVFVVGDAAMKVSFRAGRGLNTGIKGALSLSRTLTHVAEKGAWRYADFIDYASFMFGLQEREVRTRSLAMMSFQAPGDTEYTDTSVIGRIAAGQQRLPFRAGMRAESATGSKMKMTDKLDRIAHTAFRKDRLAPGIDPPRMDVLYQLINDAPDSFVRVLDASLEWNTREVGGKELHPDAFVDEPLEPPKEETKATSEKRVYNV